MAVISTPSLRLSAGVIAAVLLLNLGVSLFGDKEGDSTADAPAAPGATASAPMQPLARASAASRPMGGVNDPALIFELGLEGDLIINIDTQAALEMTLAELGPEPSGTDLQRLEDGLRKGLPPAAANEAIAMFRQYTAYSRDYARAIEGQPPADTPEQVRAMLDRTEALQRRHFGEANARALFGLQMAHSRHQLDVQAVLADPQLAAADKVARIKALRDQLPEDVRELDTGPEVVQAPASAP